MALERLCDLCQQSGVDTPALVDQGTRFGPWAYMCGAHAAAFGVGRPTILANID